MLHADEKTLLHQLAVHRGGGSLPSMLAVAGSHGLDEPTVTYLLSALVDKSIVSVSFPDRRARYDLLDTVREYMLERLDERGGLPAARKAHGEYFATLADAAQRGLRTAEWPTWMKLLEREHDNLWASTKLRSRSARSAPRRSSRRRARGDLGAAKRISEGRAFIEAALASAEEVPLPLRIELMAYLCYLATEDDDLEAAVAAGERGLSLAATSNAPGKQRCSSWRSHSRTTVPARSNARSTLPRKRATDCGHLGDPWGAASSAVTGALGALGLGDTRHRRRIDGGRRRPQCRLRRRRDPGSAARGVLGGAARRLGDGGRRILSGTRPVAASEFRGACLVRAHRPWFGRPRERELRPGRGALSSCVGCRRSGVGVVAGRTREGFARPGSRGSRRQRSG